MADDKKPEPSGDAPHVVSHQKVDDRLKTAAELGGKTPPPGARHEVEGSPVRSPEDVEPPGPKGE
jgi:hypothetical protein